MPRVLEEIDILLIDDDVADIEITKESFKKHSPTIRLHEVFSADEGLAFLRKEKNFANVRRPQIVLLDINMPGMSGIEFLKILKKDAHLKDIPIIMLTTSDSDEDIKQAYKHGANSYLTKPVDFIDFQKMIDQLSDYWFSTAKLPPKSQF